MFFDGWADIWRTLIVGAAAYAGLIVALRASGKRTLTKLNAFDLVVTVALGSTLATILLSKDVSLVEGLAAFLLLVMLQFAITWLSTRSAGVRRAVKAEPTLLLRDGRFIEEAMQRERVTVDEVMASLRGSGMADAAQAAAVVLETDGSLSVIRQSRTDSPTRSTLEGVRGA